VSNETAAEILLVDDDPALSRVYKQILVRNGFGVHVENDVASAIARLERGGIDVIVSDVVMPGLGGLEFLRAAHAHDPDVPVILMTGEPKVESAIRALEYGAFHYLIKPFEQNELADVVRRAVRLHKLAVLKREALELPGPGSKRVSEYRELEGQFSRGLSQLWMAFQPIVSWRERKTRGYEALLRSDEPTMRNPGHMLEACERLGRLHQLGRTIRDTVANESTAAPADVSFFVNLHSQDLNDGFLFDATAPLSRIASRVVLEITERASLHIVKDLSTCIAELKSLGFRIAVDDLGAGYAGLTSFTQLEPDIAKLDMSLIRGIHEDPKRRSIVRSIKKLCDELEIEVVTEGVETKEERDTLVELGCDLFQGYLFAKPARGFQLPTY
jgi:EAL domain-containing protein (putative c-di-GMP-specific phosphodiesterase class I)